MKIKKTPRDQHDIASDIYRSFCDDFCPKDRQNFPTGQNFKLL